MSPSRYVTATDAPPPDPPRVSAWRAWIADHPECDHLGVEVQQPRDDYGRGRAMVLVYFFDKGGELLHAESEEWEPELERFLLDEARAASQTREAEILRFELLLREAFRPIWREVEGGYFDAVLVHVLREGDFRDHPAVQEMLAHARPGNPSPRRLAETRAFIEAALAYVGGRLRLVRPDPEEASEILARALAAWLDERFSVSRRRRMGMVPEGQE
jgi:hypothetical protein